MKTKTKYKERSEGSVKIFQFIKALLVSLIITFACIILFAFIIKYASLSDKLITPVNLFIKGFAVLIGALILTKGASNGLIKGVLFAGVYTLLAFTIFSLLAGHFTLGIGLVADFAFSAVAGGIGGLLGVNMKAKL